jgi:hypothetical protein
MWGHRRPVLLVHRKSVPVSKRPLRSLGYHLLHQHRDTAMITSINAVAEDLNVVVDRSDFTYNLGTGTCQWHIKTVLQFRLVMHSLQSRQSEIASTSCLRSKDVPRVF